MSLFGKLSLGVWLAVLALALAGCAPDDQSPLDDEKEPHFLLGKSRVNAMDYTGAIEAFQESLEANPHSAAAHFQLACLYDTKESDAAAAIYHYREFLRLNPKADNAEVIRLRISGCKQQLAADVMQLPSAPAAQQQLEKLAEQNRQLQSQVDRLNVAVRQWNAYYAATKTNAPTAPGNFTAPPPGNSLTPDDVSPQPPANNNKPTPTKPTLVKPVKPHTTTHTVAAGETLAGIARKQSISLAALQAANPDINPKKLRVGQVLNLPAP